MNKKGFTLYEMLCVLVILCLIFLITIPIVNNIIKTGKLGTQKDSIMGLIRTVNTQVGLDGPGLDRRYAIQVPANKTLETGVTDAELGKLNISGVIPKYIKLVFDDARVSVVSGSFCLDNKNFDYTTTGVVESSNDYCSTLNPGLYDSSNTLIASWNDLVNTYGLQYEIDYTNNTSSETDFDKASSSGTSILNNPSLTSGVKLVIPEGVKYLGTNLFRNNTTLTKIYFPKSLTEIGNYAFRNDNNTGNITMLHFPIDSNLTKIGRTSFSGNKKISELFIPQKVTEIGGNAFRGQELTSNPTSLTKITFGYNSKLETIGDSAFSSNLNLKEIYFPSNLKLIDDYAFQYCISLKEITIPSSVTKIGDRAFEGYAPDSTYPGGLLMNIKTITFEEGSNLEYIGLNAFYYNESLTSIKIPASVKVIGPKAFGIPTLLTAEFETTTGWYYTDSQTNTIGTNLTISTPADNAIQFRSILLNKWTKRN